MFPPLTRLATFLLSHLLSLLPLSLSSTLSLCLYVTLSLSYLSLSFSSTLGTHFSPLLPTLAHPLFRPLPSPSLPLQQMETEQRLKNQDKLLYVPTDHGRELGEDEMETAFLRNAQVQDPPSPLVCCHLFLPFFFITLLLLFLVPIFFLYHFTLITLSLISLTHTLSFTPLLSISFSIFPFLPPSLLLPLSLSFLSYPSVQE